jgi:hypothetical protein
MFAIAQVAMDGRQTLSTQDAMTKDLQSPLLRLDGISSVASDTDASWARHGKYINITSVIFSKSGKLNTS